MEPAGAARERAAREIAGLQDSLRSRDALVHSLEARCREQVRPSTALKPATTVAFFHFSGAQWDEMTRDWRGGRWRGGRCNPGGAATLVDYTHVFWWQRGRSAPGRLGGLVGEGVCGWGVPK